MLKQRILTASVLAIVFVSILFYLPWFIFSAAIGIVMLIGAWEWANLSGLNSFLSRMLYVAVIAAISCGLAWITIWSDDIALLKTLLIAACVWWAVSLLWIQSFPTSAIIWGSIPARLVMGMFVLIPAWLSHVFLRVEPSGAWLILLVVFLVAAADIGAYFSGRAVGRRKLAPAVSPGKSWEGVIGGAIFALILAITFNLLLGGGDAWLSLFLIVVPTALVSVIGDLLESMVKRHRGVKDSSQLLPGHGGVLDRIDGLLAAAPVFALAVISTHWQV